jgi:DNA-binding MarR family transcriptional regulator
MRSAQDLRAYRNSRLYRSLSRVFRAYNRVLVARLIDRGFDDFQQSFPSLLSNLDTEGTRIGVLAARAGVTRQAAGQLLKAIEACGYVELRGAADDARVTVVHFTTRGRKLLATVFELMEEIEADYASELKAGELGRLQDALLRIADRVDPDGALGKDD